MQIRTRLTLRFIAIAAGILALVLFYVYRAYENHTEGEFFAGLETKADLTVQTTLQNERQLVPVPPVFSPNDGSRPNFRDNISIFNDAYQLVFTMHPEAEPVSVKTLQDVQSYENLKFKHKNLHGLGVVANAPSGRHYMVVAEGFCDPTGLQKLRNILIFSFLIGIAAVAAGGWYFSGQALQPVSKIVNQVDQIHPTDLAKRLETADGKDEIGRLAETFNRLLDRLEQAFRMQRQFLSNVSHEMKNPLTTIRTQLDVALQRERSPEDYRKALASVLDDVTALTEVEEKLLQLARIHTDGNQIPMLAVRLDELVWAARENVLKINHANKVLIDFDEFPEDESSLFVLVNEPLMRTALINLIENGCKYSPEKKVRVNIRFSNSGGHIVEVSDNGPGIPSEEIPLIFEPFFRSPRHRQIKGTGIGLSLTDTILRLHGVGLEVECPVSGGTVFRLSFNTKT